MIVNKKYYNNPEYRYNVAIGNFDGIHKGHKFLINKLIELKKTDLDKIALLTFHPHPVKVIYPTSINTIRRRYLIIIVHIGCRKA